MTDLFPKPLLILVFLSITACPAGSGPGGIDGGGAGRILAPGTGGTAGPAPDPSVVPVAPTGMTGGTGPGGEGDGEPSGDPGTTEATPTVTGSPQPFTPEGCPEIYFERLEAAAVVSNRPSIPPRIEIKGHLMGYLERLPELPPSGIGGATVDFFEVDDGPKKPFVSTRTETAGCFFASFEAELGSTVDLRAQWVCQKKASARVEIPPTVRSDPLAPCGQTITGNPVFFQVLIDKEER